MRDRLRWNRQDRLPICQQLIKRGHEVIGYRRSSLADFEQLGGAPAKSPAASARHADIVFSCLPDDATRWRQSSKARTGFLKARAKGRSSSNSARIPWPAKSNMSRRLPRRARSFSMARSRGTPGMVAARKAVIFLGRPARSGGELDAGRRGLQRRLPVSRRFRRRHQGQARQQFPGRSDIAGAAQAMASGLKPGVDKELLIKAVVTGSGGSTQLCIRAPWMAERKFLPLQGPAAGARVLSRAGPRHRGRQRHQDRHHRLPARHLRPRDPADRRTRCGGDARIFRNQIASERSERMIGVKKISHAVYETPDLEQQTEYYTDVLGLTRIDEGTTARLSRQQDRSAFGRAEEGIACALHDDRLPARDRR